MNGNDSNTSGDSVAVVAFKPKGSDDCLSDRTTAELQRRLEITVKNESASDIWSGAEPPDDKTLLWWPVDPASGVRIGDVPKKWDPATGAWVETGKTTPPTVLPVVKYGVDFVPAASGAQSKTVDIPDGMVNDQYFPTITITTLVGSSYQAASANMNNFGWEITSKTALGFVITFFNVPTGGLGFEWKVEAKP